MKTYQSTRTLLLASLTALSCLAPQFTYAGDGASSGGGGDTATEMRIDEIRADILKWIGKGGAEGLEHRANLSHDAYRSAMTRYLQPHAVVITSVTSAEEAATSEPELKVVINGQHKTCRGFISRKDRLPHILCNVERFASTSEADQYPLIHHEYAGLAGVELNQGDSSDYSVSAQIGKYLVSERVLRLAVKGPVIVQRRQCQQQMKGDFWSSTDASRTEDPKESDFGITTSCDRLPTDWDSQSGLKPFLGQTLRLVSGTSNCDATVDILDNRMAQDEESTGRMLQINDESQVLVAGARASVSIPLMDPDRILKRMHSVVGLNAPEAFSLVVTALSAFERKSVAVCGPYEVQGIGDYAGDGPNTLGITRIKAATCLQPESGMISEVTSRTPAKNHSYKLFTKSRTHFTVLDKDLLLIQVSTRMMKSMNGIRRGFAEASNCVYENTHVASTPIR